MTTSTPAIPTTKYYGQIASWVVIGVFVLLYKLLLPAVIDSPLWQNSTVFGAGVALSWIAGRLIGKIVARKKTSAQHAPSLHAKH